MIYPFSKELQERLESFSSGNFGLWFYKLIPLNETENFKAYGRDARAKNAADFYRVKYNDLKKNDDLKNLLGKRHKAQAGFCKIYEENGAEVIQIRAELEAPLITGIGKTHPNEVGMTFDHTMGIPYLPATSIKGLARLAHILNLIEETDKAKILVHEDELDDTHPVSLIPDMFGGDLSVGKDCESCRGKVVFLDAYPEKIPDLHVDIMNPHYGDYYGSDSAEIPPADYLDPVPVQFLTVQKGTIFVFRAIVMGKEALKESVIKALYKAMVDLGFGAKTAVGYGRFSISGDVSAEMSKPFVTKTEAQPPSTPAISQIETWENVLLTYKPNNQEITATSGSKKASAIGKDLVPDCLRSDLFEKKKKRAIAKSVDIERCGNAFNIIRIYGDS